MPLSKRLPPLLGTVQITTTSLGEFLNDCVEACHVGLDEDLNFTVKKEDRWHAGLHFVPFDNPTRDGIAGAAPVRPI